MPVRWSPWGAAGAAILTGTQLLAWPAIQVLGAAVGPGVRGVRLTVGEKGDAEVEAWPLDAAPFRTAWVDPEPFAEAGTWQAVHKTTARDAYHQRHDRALARGADEAILVNARGEVTGFLKIGQDMTERRLAERRVAESERRLRALVEGIPQLVWRGVEKR